MNDSANVLLWTEANARDNVWTRHEMGNPPYFTKDNGNDGGIAGSVTPATYTFDLSVEPGTPFDIYELVFAAPGRRSGFGRVYQEERFYLEVICPFEIAGDLNDDCEVGFLDLLTLLNNWG